MNPPFLNIAAYRFTPLDHLPALRQQLFDAALAQGILGTVLLAEEGVNLCLAGPPERINAWLALWLSLVARSAQRGSARNSDSQALMDSGGPARHRLMRSEERRVGKEC